jgi:hypothetical protein
MHTVEAAITVDTRLFVSANVGLSNRNLSAAILFKAEIDNKCERERFATIFYKKRSIFKDTSIVENNNTICIID